MKMVQTARRSRRREARRDEFLTAASAVAAEDGIEALTMKALSDRLDCAVGSAYTYFRSKGALVAAMQAAAIGRLVAAYDGAAPGVEPLLAERDEDERTIGRLVAFGRFIVAAEREMPHDFRLQQQLLATPTAMESSDAEAVVPMAFDLLGRPQALIAAAAAAGALDGDLEDGVTFERAVTWVAAVNGVLSLDSIQIPAAGLFDTALMADRLSHDLLRSWGADPAVLAAMSALVPDRRITGLLATAAHNLDEEQSP